MSYQRIKSLVGEELKSYFRPEFLNRLDEIIVFRQLTKKEVGLGAVVILCHTLHFALFVVHCTPGITWWQLTKKEV